MAEFPYTFNAGSTKRFFAEIQGAGVPPKATQKYLESLGFKTKSDRAVIPILRYLGFLDTAGVPTDTWRAFRDKARSGAVMAAAIRKAYPDLFATFPDAYRKDTEALRNYFSTKTSVGERTVGAIVSTFATLCQLADFEARPLAGLPPTPSVAEGVQLPPGQTPGGVPQPPGLTVNINIELGLPPTDDVSLYDKLFASMRKHLFSEKKDG